MASRGSLVMSIVTNHRERIETILSGAAKESEIYLRQTLENGWLDSRYFGSTSPDIQIVLQLAHTKFGEITVLEPQYRLENNRVRPFILGAKVSPRGCSRPLQRAIVDFAADQPFALVQLKLREHYGFEIGESTIQRITLGHAQVIFESDRASLEFPKAPG